MRTSDVPFLSGETIAVPGYLAQTYWWAYVHPNAVQLFERQWLVNLILWGNFGRLRDAALDALAGAPAAHAAGRLRLRRPHATAARSASRRAAASTWSTCCRVQLDNLARKLPGDARVGLHPGRQLRARHSPTRTYDQALLFFLLHEQPEDVRRRTLAEALRVVKPGGRLVIVDYHRPARSCIRCTGRWSRILKHAGALRHGPLASTRSPSGSRRRRAGRRSRSAPSFGGLYQRLDLVTR